MTALTKLMLLMAVFLAVANAQVQPGPVSEQTEVRRLGFDSRDVFYRQSYGYIAFAAFLNRQAQQSQPHKLAGSKAVSGMQLFAMHAVIVRCTPWCIIRQRSCSL